MILWCYGGKLRPLQSQEAPEHLQARRRIAERLFLEVYDLELAMENKNRIWTYRKAAWAVDEMDGGIEEIYTAQGIEGLLAIPNIGKGLAREIEAMLRGPDWK